MAVRSRRPAAGAVDLWSDDQTLTLPVDAVSGEWFSVIVGRANHLHLISAAIFVNEPLHGI